MGYSEYSHAAERAAEARGGGAARYAWMQLSIPATGSAAAIIYRKRYIYISMYLSISIYLSMCLSIYEFIYIYMYICIYMYVCI
jgi:hypothetical protein